MTRLPGDRAAERGIPDWDPAETYDDGDIVRGPDGAIDRLYEATADPRTGAAPGPGVSGWAPFKRER